MRYGIFFSALVLVGSSQVSAQSVYVAPGGVYIASANVHVGAGNGYPTYGAPGDKIVAVIAVVVGRRTPVSISGRPVPAHHFAIPANINADEGGGVPGSDRTRNFDVRKRWVARALQQQSHSANCAKEANQAIPDCVLG
jgi:hypothetical protein